MKEKNICTKLNPDQCLSPTLNHQTSDPDLQKLKPFYFLEGLA